MCNRSDSLAHLCGRRAGVDSCVLTILNDAAVPAGLLRDLGWLNLSITEARERCTARPRIADGLGSATSRDFNALKRTSSGVFGVLPG